MNEPGRHEQRHRQRDLRRRERGAEARRGPCARRLAREALEHATRSGRVLCSAGNRPKASPVASDSAARRPARVPSIAEMNVADARRQQRRDARSVQRATSRLAAPPSSASGTTRSAAGRRAASGWRRSTAAPPSRRRAPAARASSRLAMFAHAMSSTRPVTPNRSGSGARASLVHLALAAGARLHVSAWPGSAAASARSSRSAAAPRRR